MKAACQLRALIRNDEALAEHYLAQIEGEYPATGNHHLTLLLRRGVALGRMNARRDLLASLSAALPPACTSRANHLNGDNSGLLEPTTTAAR